MRSRALSLLLLTALLSAFPLAAQETLLLKSGEAVPAFACAQKGCERLAWLPDTGNVTVVAGVEGRKLEGSALWYEVLLECPCFDYEKIALSDPPWLDPKAESFALWHPDFAPGGEHIAAVHRSYLYLWDAQSGELLVKERLDAYPLQHMDMSWSPDGKRILVGGASLDDEHEEYVVSRSILMLLDADGQSRRTLDLQDGIVLGVAWSNGGASFLTLGDAMRIRDAQQEAILVTIDASFTTAAWSPDDTHIVTGGYMEQPGELAIWDSASGDLIDFMDTGCHIVSVNWSPDGSRIAWASIGEGCGGLHILDVVSGNVSDSLTDSGHVVTVTWSPDGRFILANTGYRVQILDPADGQVYATLAEFSNGFFPGLSDWSPAGDQIAIAGFVSIPPEGNQREKPTKAYAAWIWDLTLIPAGPVRAFIHSSHLAGG